MSKEIAVINLEEFTDFATFHDVLADLGAEDGDVSLYFKPTETEPLLVVSPKKITEKDLKAAEKSFTKEKYSSEYWLTER